MPDPHIAQIDRALSTGADLRPYIGACFAFATEQGSAVSSTLLEQLQDVLARHPVTETGPVAILAGALVENGADVQRFPSMVFERLSEMLANVPRETNADDEEAPMPDEFYEFERAAMACLSRSSELRKTLPHRSLLLSEMHRYSERYGFLGKMLSVLDDEPLVVVDASTSRAWRVCIGGIADNFQLHTLLLAALAGEGPDKISGAPPSAAAAASCASGPPTHDTVFSRWQLMNWFGLRSDGAAELASLDRAWIWNEGFPAEIAALDGMRIVVISPHGMQRSWNAGRIFADMPGTLRVEQRLDDHEARALVTRMLAAQRA